MATFGQLGDGTTFFRQVPVDVSGLASGVSSIALGWDHSCAITTAGGLKCWGYNSNGQLGDGTNADKSSPVDVAGLASGVAMASGGAVHTCAIASGGVAKCWGSNGYGQLGNGSAIDSNVPVDVWFPPKNSKAGFRIAFVSDRDGNNEIYKMNGDGTAQVRITNNPASDIEPSLGPGRQHDCLRHGPRW